MSVRTTFSRGSTPLQPDYIRRDGGSRAARQAVFRFSVPVLRVRDVAATVSWYARHLGFAADAYPETGVADFAILERDGVQLLVRKSVDAGNATRQPGTGWDLYIWADGVDLARLETSIGAVGGVVRTLSPMGPRMAEIEVRDPDGYVLCIGGPIHRR